ncbi:hypothetical protein BOTBODRAFT_34194 [Botryobasidium botryosum FD-172 SS1]|uniref:AB hydrolase-1 domain-containing protein n=1 Tax=Botryobasidium botryosum (strain FD-172 SS1) TaxID=930990 RepID=A0A067MAX7_BOTB1|nr:hypothetical protein BOTBODRAFT_34194 [Botryobasidium botryosum FD-172 SS1]
MGSAVLKARLEDEVAPSGCRHWSFYPAFLFALSIWVITPCSWAFVAWTLTTGNFSSLTGIKLLLFPWAVAESLFSVYHLYLSRRLSVSTTIHNPPVGLPFFVELFTRILKLGLIAPFPHKPKRISQIIPTLPPAKAIRSIIRTWAGHVPWSTIPRSAVRNWLLWCIYGNTPMDILTAEESAQVEEMLGLLELRAGEKFADDATCTGTIMRLTVDPMKTWGRPLVLYSTIGITNACLRKWYAFQYGVTFDVHAGLEYLLRMPPSWTPSQAITHPPILFLHGLGAGLIQYHMTFKHIFADPTLASRPILIPLQPHISQDILHHQHLNPLSRVETLQALEGLLSKLGFVPRRMSENEKAASGGKVGAGEVMKSQLTVLSHSNGTIVHAWLLKAYPDLVNRSCFVDPVTFCLWEGDVCYNFVYKSPTNAMEVLARYFVGSELGIANSIQRHFDWTSNLLWFEEIPNGLDPHRAMFFLGGKDAILNAQNIRRYLSSVGVEKGLKYDANGHHGSALFAGAQGFNEIMQWLQEECEGEQ